MDDKEIVRLYTERNEQAVACSQEKYGAYCYSIGYNILYSKEDTEECVNETWLKAWNSIPPHKPSKLSAFFGRITRNLAFDRYKASKRQKRSGEMAAVLEELSECVPSFENTEQAFDSNELERHMDEFLRTLSEKDCAIFLARYWYAKPINTIAADYSLKINTVKASLFRTRNKLKGYLEKQGIYI